MAYIPYNPNPNNWDTGDCVIRALSIATGPASTMTVTPAAVEEYFNVSRAINADVWNGCCETVAVCNTSAQPILVQNANIIFSRPDLLVSR